MSRNACETASTHERRRSSFGSAPHHVCLHVVVRRARAAVKARVIRRLLQSRSHPTHRLTLLEGRPGRVARRPRPTLRPHRRLPSRRPSHHPSRRPSRARARLPLPRCKSPLQSVYMSSRSVQTRDYKKSSLVRSSSRSFVARTSTYCVYLHDREIIIGRIKLPLSLIHI